MPEKHLPSAVKTEIPDYTSPKCYDIVFFQTSFPTFHYSNARTVLLVLVSNDLGGDTSQSDSLLVHTCCTGHAQSNKTFQTLNYLSIVCLTTMFVEHHVVASYNLLSLQIINHFNFIFMLIVQSQLNDIALQFKQFD